MPWLRLYTEIRHDRKLRRLPASHRWLWIVILTMAKDSPRAGWLLVSKDTPITTDDLADEAAISSEDAAAGVRAFLDLDMIENIDGIFHVISWDKRQFCNDNSTERWRKWKRSTKGASHQHLADEVSTSSQQQSNACPTSRQRQSNVGQTFGQPKANLDQTSHQPGADVGPTAPEYRAQSINKATGKTKDNVVDMHSASEDAVRVQNELQDGSPKQEIESSGLIACEPTSSGPSASEVEQLSAPPNMEFPATTLARENESPPFYLTRRKRRLSGWRLEHFEEFWLAFNYKKGKAEAADAWLDIPDPTPELASRIIKAARKEAVGRPALIARKQTPKWAQGWITGRRWEDWEENGAPAGNRDCASMEPGQPGQGVDDAPDEVSDYQRSIREAVKRFL
jgi:hypothetical protein